VGDEDRARGYVTGVEPLSRLRLIFRQQVLVILEMGSAVSDAVQQMTTRASLFLFINDRRYLNLVH
jgi:hypothetical protein